MKKNITSREVYVQPLLQALTECGGTITTAEMVTRVFALVQDSLTPEDLVITNGTKEPRWRKRLGWACTTLKEEGVLLNPEHGVWIRKE